MPIEPIKYVKPPYLLAPEKKEEKKVAEVAPPKPPEIPEYFPGFGAQFRAAGQSLFDIQKRMGLAQQQMAKLQTPIRWLWPWQNIPKGAVGFTALVGGYARLGEEEFQQQRQAAQQELDIVTTTYARASWRQKTLAGLPLMMADSEANIFTAEDYLNQTPVQYQQLLTDEDRSWLAETFKKLSPYAAPKTPEQYEGMNVEDIRQAILNDIINASAATAQGNPISLHRLTVEEIIANLQRGKEAQPKLPPGLTAEDLRDLFSSVEIDEETQFELGNIRTAVQELQRQWAEEAGYLELIRQGLLTPEAPKLTPWEFTKMVATQPVLATMELLDKYFNILPRPLAAMVFSKTLGGIKPDSPAARLRELHQQYVEQGLSDWESYTASWNTAVVEAKEAKGFWKGASPYMIGEAIFDPTTWIGMGIATKLISKVPGIAGRVVLPSGRVMYTGAAKYVGAFEQGFNYAFEYTFGLPFKGALWSASKAWSKIPKPATLRATQAGRGAFLELRALIGRMYPERRNLTHVTTKEVKEAVDLAFDQYAKIPTETGNQAVRTGHRLTEFDYLGKEDLQNLLRGVVDTGDVTDHALSAVTSDLAESFTGVPSREVAGKIIGRFGDATESGVAKLANRIDKFKARTAESVTSLIEGASARDALMNISTHIKDTVSRNLSSPVAKYMEQAGKSVSWLTRQSDRLLTSSVMTALERKLVSPVANWYLLFANLGPMNFGEAMMRSWLGGGELLWPKRFGGYSEASRFFKGLDNAPYEFVVADKAVQRMDIAAVRPSTGETVLMKQGKIPFITKDTKLGFKMTVAGKEYFIGSAQSYNAMWADMVTKQRAWDSMVQYRKALYEVAPDEVGLIDDIFIRNSDELDAIGAWSKADKRDITRVLWQDTIGGGPEALLEHMDLTQNELQKRMIVKQLRQELDRATEVPAHVKEMVVDEILEGVTAKDIPGRIAAYKEFLRETDIINLKVNAEVIQDTVQHLVDTPPTTLGELQADMKYVSDMTEMLSERLHDSAAEIKLRGDKLLARSRDNFYEASYQQMADFMQVPEEQIGKLLKSIETNPLYDTMDDAAKLAFNDVKDTIRLRTANILKARESNIEVLSQIRKTPRKARDDNFWQSIRRKQEEVWNQYEVNNSRLFKASLRAQRRYMNSIGKVSDIPEFVPEVVGELTPNHLAYLMGVTGSDLYRGLTKVSGMITVRPKQQFVDYFSEAAEAYAAKFGKTATGIGFTDDAIGGVYDQLWNSMGIDARMVAGEPLAPAMMQLDGIGNELERISSVTKLADSDYAHWRTYVRGVADDLEKLPMYKPVVPKPDIGLGERFATPDDLKSLEADYQSLIKRGKSTSDAERIVYGENRRPQVVRGKLEQPEGLIMLDAATVERITKGATDAARKVPVPQSSVLAGVPSEISSIAEKVAKAGSLTAAESKFYSNPSNKKLIESVIEEMRKRPAGFDLEHEIQRWFSQSDNEALQIIGRTSQGNAEYLAEIRKLLKEQYPSGYIRIFRGSGKAKNLALDREFTNVTSSRRTALEFENTWGAPFDPGHPELYKKWKPGGPEGKPSVDNVLVKVDDVVSIGAVEESELIIPAATLKERIANPLTVPPSARTDIWFSKKESAMTAARQASAEAFPTYGDDNIADAIMHTTFPFFTYEKFRWKWLPQNLIRKPFLPVNLGRYMNYSDQGYVPVPGTDLQFNPLRGTIFMGGLRRLYMKDFPEYYDAFPGMEIIDYIGRLGFYPGIHVLGPMVLWGATQGKPELGEILPAWMKSPLNAARAIAPEQAGKVIDHFFPDRFRDYITMLELGRMGYDADEIWRKKESGAKLTEDEQKLWLQAENKATGLKGILMEQTGMFRIRPQEYIQMQQEMKELIAEMTGVSVEIQDEIQRNYPVTGKRFSDYYKLDALQQKILYEQESYKRWQGVTTPLYPSSWQQEDIAIKDYYESLDKLYDDYRKNGVYDEQGKLLSRSINDVTAQWIRGEIGPDQWLSARSNLLTQASAAARELGLRAYPDVPKTLEAREARYAERGLPSPTYSPDQELMYMYYDIQPELKWNWESGREEYDYDSYFAKLDIFIETLQEPLRSRFLERIQYDWNGMEKLYWQVSRDYLRPYRNARSAVLARYSPEEQQAIRRFEVARGAERDMLRSLVREDGRKLISAFEADTRKVREAMRRVDPNLDAWLYFFGTIDTFQSEQAKIYYNDSLKKYMRPEMAR